MEERLFSCGIQSVIPVSIVNLVLFSTGTDFMWTSPVIPILQQNDTLTNPLERPITTAEESLIAGLPAFGSLLGSLMSGKVPDIYGRRNVLIVVSSIKLVSYVVLAFATTVYLYYTTRFLLGLAFGIAVTVIPTFITEFTQDFNRGKFGSYIGLFITLGNLYGFLIGPVFSVKVFTLLCAAPLIFNIICLIFFIPETPVYLVNQRNRKKAIQSLEKILHHHTVALKNDSENFEDTTYDKNSAFAALLQTKGLRNGLIVSVGINSLQQLSGITAIVGFIAPVFNSVDCRLTGNMSGIIVGFIQVPAFLLASIIIDKLERRILLLLSTAMSGISLLLLGLSFYMINLGVYVEILSWISVICLILYFVSYCLGLGPLPLIIMSELFPNEVKVLAASITTFMMGVSVFLTVSSFPLILQFLGAVWCFFVFSVICFLGVIFIYVCLPETKGKTVAEIQKILST